MTVILVTGNAGSGKTTASNILKEYLHTNVYALGDNVKAMTVDVLKLFGYNVSIQDLNTSDVKEKYRHIMQQIGTDICQKYFNNICWCEIIHNNVAASVTQTGYAIISDVRFLHEVNYFKHYYNTIVVRVNGSNTVKSALNHRSEQEIDCIYPDIVINNNYSMTDLKQQLEAALTKIR